MRIVADNLGAEASNLLWASFSLAAIMGLSGSYCTILAQESPAPKLKLEAASVRVSAPGVDRYEVRVSPSTMSYTGITLKAPDPHCLENSGPSDNRRPGLARFRPVRHHSETG
jgi:hypothetical protein